MGDLQCIVANIFVVASYMAILRYVCGMFDGLNHWFWLGSGLVLVVNLAVLTDGILARIVRDRMC